MALKHVWTKLRDALRFRWAKSKFDFVPSGVLDKFSFASCHHIVVLKLDGKLGDTQVMTHFYSALRAQVPRITLSVVCSPNLAPIYQNILGFDQVLVASRKPKAKEIKELCAKIKAMTPVSAVGSIAGKIDLVVTTEPNFRPRDFIFNYELAPRYVAGCETKVDSVNLLIYDPSKRTKAVAECFVDLMDLGHLAHDKIAYTRLVTPESLAKMRKWLHLAEGSKEASLAANEACEHPITPRQQRFLLAINPRASSKSRSFTDEFTITLIQELQAKFGAAHGYLTYKDAATQSDLAQVGVAQVGISHDGVAQASLAQAAGILAEGMMADGTSAGLVQSNGTKINGSHWPNGANEAKIAGVKVGSDLSSAQSAIPSHGQRGLDQGTVLAVNELPQDALDGQPANEPLEVEEAESNVAVGQSNKAGKAIQAGKVGESGSDLAGALGTLAKAADADNSAQAKSETDSKVDVKVKNKEDAKSEYEAKAEGAIDASHATWKALSLSAGNEAGNDAKAEIGNDAEHKVPEPGSGSGLRMQRDLEFVVLTPPHADGLKAKVKAAAVACGASVFFLPDESTVLDLSSTIDLCDALISVDTAAVHMACASHRPQLCVYTGTNLNESIRWAPLEEQAEVLRCEGKTVPEIPESMLLERASAFVKRYIGT